MIFLLVLFSNNFLGKSYFYISLKEIIMAKRSSKKRVIPARELAKTHTGHANKHLCDLVAKRQMNKVSDLSGGAKYICHICGRAAAKAGNLCEPVAI